MKTPKDKYNNDPMYQTLVDTMVAHMHQCYYTPSEMREAAILASILYEEQKIRGMEVPELVRKAFGTLIKWTNEKSND